MTNQSPENKDKKFSELKLDYPYNPTDGEVTFFKEVTGISDDEELKKHVLSVQEEAWKVAHYMCIRMFGFMKSWIIHEKKYPELLEMGKENPQAIYLEYACCFGNDARKAIHDGFPLQNVVASDIEKPFWDLGHMLFKTTPETYPVPFVHGSVFDHSLIAPREPFYEPPTTARPVLTSLASLTPLQGHVTAIHVGAFFHLFGKEQQIEAAKALASLLSPAPGSFIFGGHAVRDGTTFTNFRGQEIHCFTSEEWIALWDEEVFKKGTVKVENIVLSLDELIKASGDSNNKTKEESGIGRDGRYMLWSITRL